MLKQICEKHAAGDRIYETVQGVKGLHRAIEVDPYPDWASQYGMKAPWIRQYLDAAHLYHSLGDREGGFYWFLEAPPAYGASNAAPYRRSFFIKSEQKPRPTQLVTDYPPLVSSDGFLYETVVRSATALISRYGWTAEDLTTIEMRAHWITGGRLIIFDRETGKTLAERVHFYRATGPSVKMAWAMGIGCDQAESGYAQGRYVAPNWALFVKHVLQPVQVGPTDQQMKEMADPGHGKDSGADLKY